MTPDTGFIRIGLLNRFFAGRANRSSLCFTPCFVLACGLLTAAFGCVRVGPNTIPRARFNYNETLSRSQNEQLLLNLVRLRYRDTPIFLDVGTVITQYTISARAGAAPNINVDGVAGTELGVDIGGSYSEQPTITYEPLKGADFTQRLLTPVSPSTIILLSQSGWSIERLLLCCVEAVNEVINAPGASGPTPERFPDNARFRELAGMFRELQSAGLLDFQVVQDDQKSEIFIRIRQMGGGAASETLARVRDMLGLPGDRDVFRLTSRGLRRAESEIALAGRSLLGVLFFLSHAVDAPPLHEQRGLVTQTAPTPGGPTDWTTVTGSLLKIRAHPSTPADAFARVQYRGHWFYIQDSDLQSKATFNLLTYLFSLQAAGEKGLSPLLTVPVGG